jgi:UDP-sugar transporter A1/2/3
MSRARTSPLELASRERAPTSSSVKIGWFGIVALACFVVQHGLGALLVRYTKTRLEDEYDSSVAVFLQEVAVKLPLSFLLLAVEKRGVSNAASHVLDDAQANPKTWLKTSFIAVVYTAQMNLIYIGYENIESAIGQCVYQSKLFFTAVLTRLILRRVLEWNQWVSIFILMTGVIIVQTDGKDTTGKAGQNPLLGGFSLLGAATCSALASVYFESVLKTARVEDQPSLWLLNIQLAFYGGLTALVGVVAQGTNSWMDGISWLVWVSIVWQAAGGLVVALTIKYADNLMRCFAQGLSLVLVTVVSSVFLQFKIHGVFLLGAVLVVFSLFLYTFTPLQCMSFLQGIVYRLKGRRQILEEYDGGRDGREGRAPQRVLIFIPILMLLLGLFGIAVCKVTFTPTISRNGITSTNTQNESFPRIPVFNQSLSAPPPPVSPPLGSFPPFPPPQFPPMEPHDSPLSPLSPLSPPQPPASYQPASGCDAELNAFCQSESHSHCSIQTPSGGWGVPFLLARHGVGAYGNGVEWRCYDPSCLQDEITPVHGCHAYCTRNAELSDILARCREGRYTLRSREGSPILKRTMIHLSRDEWKLQRIKDSVSEAGLQYEELGIELREGVILRDHPELLVWALNEHLMSSPRDPQKLGNLGSALAHLTLWDELSRRNDSHVLLVLEDNALWTRETESAILHFSALDFDFLNFRVIRAEGTPTSEDGLRRFPNNEFIEPPAPFLWIFDPLPNLWLSSYLITPRGARMLLDEMRMMRSDMSILPIDQVAVMAMYRSSNMRCYAIEHERFFGHVQTGSDSRVQFNGG